jgi:hypothetical protein
VTALQDDLTLKFTAPLWRWEARRGLWTFVSLPTAVTADIRDLAGDLPRGFGAVRAHARVGTVQWWTSVFPQEADGASVLPIKRNVRDESDLALGDDVRAWVQLHP